MSTNAKEKRPVVVRRARPSDAAGIAQFGVRTFAETYGEYNTPEDLSAYISVTYGERQQREELENPSCEYILLEMGANLVGFVFLHEGSAAGSLPPGRPIEIRRFYVSSELHGHGVAAELMDAAVSAAKRRGAEVLWLGVWEENGRAIRFYEKHGFRKVGRQRFLLGGSEQRDFVMARVLGED